MDVVNTGEPYGFIKGEVMTVVMNVCLFSLSPSLPAFLQVRCSGCGNRRLCQGGSCHGSEDPMLMATGIIPETGTCTCIRWSNQNADQGFGVGGSVEKIMVMMCK